MMTQISFDAFEVTSNTLGTSDQINLVDFEFEGSMMLEFEALMCFPYLRVKLCEIP